MHTYVQAIEQNCEGRGGVQFDMWITKDIIFCLFVWKIQYLAHVIDLIAEYDMKH